MASVFTSEYLAPAGASAKTPLLLHPDAVSLHDADVELLAVLRDLNLKPSKLPRLRNVVCLCTSVEFNMKVATRNNLVPDPAITAVILHAAVRR